MDKRIKKLTEEEAIAECYRRVSEHERSLPPYERELFLQRLDRNLAKYTPRVSREVLDGGCVLLQPRGRK
jgi:hypothetical protein